MNGNTSLNTSIRPDFHYTWLAIYEDGTYLAELDDGIMHSIRDVDQQRLSSLCMISTESLTNSVFKLDAKTGQFYHGDKNITPWDEHYDVRGNITEYRHARYYTHMSWREVHARSIAYHVEDHRIQLKLFIGNTHYEITRV